MAISIVSRLEKTALDRIARQYKIPIEERPLPTDEDVADLVGQRMIALLESRSRNRDKLQVERSHRFAPLARSLAEHEEETAIITMLLDDFYQEVLHSPVPQPDSSRKPDPRESKKSKRLGSRRRGFRRDKRH